MNAITSINHQQLGRLQIADEVQQEPETTTNTAVHTLSFATGDIAELDLDDLCCACAVKAEVIIELVAEGVIDSVTMHQNHPPQQWRFTRQQLHRAQLAIRLYRDLEVNLAEIALALQMLDERAAVKSKPGGK